MNVRGTGFASDYDGTLCQSNWDTGEEVFDPAVLEAVRRYQAAGGRFGICTGRSLAMVTESIRGILDLDFYIVTTGAQVFDRDLNPLFEQPIDRDVAQALYERYASDEMFMIAVTDSGFMSVGRQMAPQFSVVSSLDDVEGKLLGISLECHGNEPLAHAVCAEMNELFGASIEGFQNLGSVDVVARGCSKGTGLEIVRRKLGLSCVAGAGDSYNDLPLLAAADPSYTFCSSPQEVRDAATYVVKDLAEALHHLMS